MNKLLSFLLLVVSLESCSDHQQAPPAKGPADLNSAFQEAIHKVSPAEEPKNYLAYLVIPNTGCDGCINDAEDLLKTVVNTSPSVRFVLRNLVSLKMIKLKLGIDPIQNPKILMDTTNQFSKGILRSIYPRVFFMNTKGSVRKEMDVSPGEDGLAALREELSKK